MPQNTTTSLFGRFQGKTHMYEPEDFLETLDRMIELNEGMMQATKKEDLKEVLSLDLARLRDLHKRIRLQFGMDEVTWH